MGNSEFQTSFDSDEYIFREGDAGECAYIIDQGLVEVTLQKDNRKLVIATLSKGDILGEMAIIDRMPRTASARAIVPTQVTAIPLEYVSRKIDEADPTVRLFLRIAMTRYRDLNVRLGQVFESLSLDPDGADFAEVQSTTMELKNVIGQFAEMQQRIDSAMAQPAAFAAKSPDGDATLRDAKNRLTQEKRLGSALNRSEFRLYYQPIVDLESGRIAGCEALVRWRLPSGKLVAPGQFIEIAENSGMMLELGYWIAEEACAFQRRLAKDFEQDLFVGINLSGKQFEDSLLIANLAVPMDTHGVNPQRIKFEITESLLVENPELAAQSLHLLKETGATLAIDDFGTGYSSLSYLHRLPIDNLKIDRSFICSMEQQKDSQRIVKSLVNLAHDLGMDVVAEGIESADEAGVIRGYGTRYGQGFHFSRPLPESELIKLLVQPKLNRTG